MRRPSSMPRSPAHGGVDAHGPAMRADLLHDAALLRARHRHERHKGLNTPAPEDLQIDQVLHFSSDCWNSLRAWSPPWLFQSLISWFRDDSGWLPTTMAL